MSNYNDKVWDLIPDKFKYRTISRNGVITAFVNKPTYDKISGEWVANWDDDNVIEIGKISIPVLNSHVAIDERVGGEYERNETR